MLVSLFVFVMQAASSEGYFDPAVKKFEMHSHDPRFWVPASEVPGKKKDEKSEGK